MAQIFVRAGGLPVRAPECDAQRLVVALRPIDPRLAARIAAAADVDDPPPHLELGRDEMIGIVRALERLMTADRVAPLPDALLDLRYELRLRLGLI